MPVKAPSPPAENAVTHVRRPATSPPALALGVDTGGTYTDAVILAAGTVIAQAKALTTHWDLTVGLAEAIRAVLAELSDPASRERIQLVSVSTTLATNAVVEHRFSPICTLLVGFDAPMLARAEAEGTALGTVVCIDGGHDATGEELAPLDGAQIEQAVRTHAEQVDGFAVAAAFSVRNPSHELRARAIIRALCAKPVTCAHELSSRLDAPRRALTAALNARLTPQIQRLVDALRAVLRAETVDAPLMLVKGDGTLVRAEVALESPVETILSGPAATLVGAAFLSGEAEFVAADIGGTTTDCAIVTDGRPMLSADGALIGGWRTMVQAVDARTQGLGGDSEIGWDRRHQLSIGPRRVMPLSRLAAQWPAVLADLRVLAAGDRLPEHPCHYALAHGTRRPERLTSAERKVWESLSAEPRRLSAITRSPSGVQALRRLADAGFATIAGFTPTDALHVLGSQHMWNAEAATVGAELLALEERAVRGSNAAASATALAERVVEQVIRASARAVLATALARDPAIEAQRASYGVLGERLIDDMISGRRFSSLLDGRLALSVPLVAVGAPARAYYPEVARRLQARLVVPDSAAVCNAVGAVAGVVSARSDVLVDQPEYGVFRVHDPAGARDFSAAEAAIAFARERSQALAQAAARHAGAGILHVNTTIEERRAQIGGGGDYLAEALVRSLAVGRPTVATERAAGAGGA